MKHLLIILSGVLLVACVDVGAKHQANVYDSAAVNQRQEVKTVSILSIVPAKVEVDNTRNKDIARGIGSLAGALTGALVTPGGKNDFGGALIGGVVGNTAADLAVGEKKLVDGVQIIYREGRRTLSSAQVGRPCDYALGAALVIVTQANETRIQSNHDCIEGQEMVAGYQSKLGNIGGIQAEDQDSLDDLERRRELLAKQREVQEQITGLNRETQRSSNAAASADLELDRDRQSIDRTKAENEAIRQRASGERSYKEGLGDGLRKGGNDVRVKINNR